MSVPQRSLLAFSRVLLPVSKTIVNHVWLILLP